MCFIYNSVIPNWDASTHWTHTHTLDTLDTMDTHTHSQVWTEQAACSNNGSQKSMSGSQLPALVEGTE